MNLDWDVPKPFFDRGDQGCGIISENNSIFFREILMKDKSEGHINAKKENPGSGYLPNKSKFIDHASKFSITSLKPHDTFEVIMDLISKIFDSDSCSLLLPNPNTNRLDFVSAYGIKAEELGSSKVPSSKEICQWVFVNHKPFISTDNGNKEPFKDLLRSESDYETYNVAVVPLLLNGRCLGVVEIINKKSISAFTPEKIELLKALSQKIAVLVENELLFDRCSNQFYQRNTMLDLAREVNTTRELPDLLNFIVITVAELLNAEASSLLLREGDVLRFEIAYGEKGTELKKFTVPLGAGIAGSVALSGKSTIVNQAEIEGSGIFKEIDKQSGFTTRNLIAVPLRAKENIIGVVEVVNSRNTEGFSEDDIALLEGFSNQAAIAIERAQLVEKRIQAEKMATIGRTVAGLAHCIKNMANALKAGEYIVDKGFRDNNMDLLNKGWNITKQGNERIRDLVLDMLTISKKREPEYSLCDPREIVTEIIDMTKEQAADKNVRVETKHDETLDKVKVDRKNIFRCVLNLVTNALDASEKDKGIIKIEIFENKEKPFFGFRIIDNGQGISEENQKKLLTEFFSTKGSKGTGLGLSVTQAIVSDHGGSIKCDSQLGEGTTFTIELPKGI
jgi:signal transduction histidine kinase